MKPCWIDIISYDDARGKLRALYERIKGPDNNIDNIMLAHSLRPHSMTGHMALYKNVLHHSSNTIATWFLEAIGVYVSMLNDCHYCYTHHYQGMKRQLQDDDRAQAIWNALEQRQPSQIFSEQESAIMDYAKKLTEQPGTMQESDVQALRKTGLSDGEILEVNQVVSYFAYANRTVLGLGVTTQGDVIGLSPRDTADSDNWQHH